MADLVTANLYKGLVDVEVDTDGQVWLIDKDNHMAMQLRTADSDMISWDHTIDLIAALTQAVAIARLSDPSRRSVIETLST